MRKETMEEERRLHTRKGWGREERGRGGVAGGVRKETMEEERRLYVHWRREKEGRKREPGARLGEEEERGGDRVKGGLSQLASYLSQLIVPLSWRLTMRRKPSGKK